MLGARPRGKSPVGARGCRARRAGCIFRRSPSTAAGEKPSRMSQSLVRPLVALVALLCAAPPLPAQDAWRPDGVRYLARAEWGAKAPVARMERHAPERITIHHTATPQAPGRTLAQKLRGLQSFSQAPGALADGGTKPAWPDIPYHYYVAVDGSVGEGREVGYVGDSNTAYDPRGHVLIVVEGNFETEQPTPAQWAALVRLTAQVAERFGIAPTRIDGHRDFAQTLCPGRNLEARLPRLRASVEAAS